MLAAGGWILVIRRCSSFSTCVQCAREHTNRGPRQCDYTHVVSKYASERRRKTEVEKPWFRETPRERDESVVRDEHVFFRYTLPTYLSVSYVQALDAIYASTTCPNYPSSYSQRNSNVISPRWGKPFPLMTIYRLGRGNFLSFDINVFVCILSSHHRTGSL